MSADSPVNIYESSKDDEYFLSPRPEMLCFIPPNCRTLLDVGCGAGEFGALVKRALSAEVWGVDLSSKAIRLAEQRIDNAIHAPFADSLELPDHYFDAITFNDSLEHFPDPLPPLATCKRLLKPDGVVVCSLPNVRYIENVCHFLIEMDWKYETAGILDYTHLRFFTKKSMGRTFADAGYYVHQVTGIKPHYWSGKKIFLLRLLFSRWVEDMKYQNYVVVASPVSPAPNYRAHPTSSPSLSGP